MTISFREPDVMRAGVVAAVKRHAVAATSEADGTNHWIANSNKVAKNL